jgi:hypothetical protein
MDIQSIFSSATCIANAVIPDHLKSHPDYARLRFETKGTIAVLLEAEISEEKAYEIGKNMFPYRPSTDN